MYYIIQICTFYTPFVNVSTLPTLPIQATVSLGAMYYHGTHGLLTDRRRAFELYNIAAELGTCCILNFN